MKIVSWNVNSLNVRLPHLEQWLEGFAPDVVGLQETKLEDHKFPAARLAELGWNVVFAGQKTYNGVALLARSPIEDVQIGIPGFEDEQKRVIAGTINGVRVINLYVVNGQDVGTDKYAYKLRWLAAVREWVAAELARHPQLVVMGDFNIAPDDRDVPDAAVWNDNHILTSTAERAGLQALLDLGLQDAFRLKHQDSGIFSWWDYRMNGFKRNLGLRIDLILASTALAAQCRASYVDKTPRGWERPSDHAPVVAEFS